MQIEDLTLLKCLGKGSFGEVFLSTKAGKRELFATKKIDRQKADQPSIKKYFENEIKILNSLRHPNIVKLEEVKMTKDYYYIVMEYINGGSLTDCLKKYQQKTKKAFPEEIVQYLMRQIVDAIKYLHGLKIIHRDLKLDNIMVSFDNENDKNMLNLMRAKIKIIDFGFAIHLAKSNLAFSALGSPINMDPKILRKFSKRGEEANKLGYDYKADIWSLGTICYEMLIGQAVFNAETMNDLVKKVENGSYSVPTSVSKEMVSFLNGMLQYDPNNRLSAEELAKHAFLTRRINEFSKIDTRRVSKKINNKDLNINVKQNQTIWAIFNEEDEKKLVNIRGGRDLPAPEGPGPVNNNYQDPQRRRTDGDIQKIRNNLTQNNNNNFGNTLHKANTMQYPTFSSINQGSSFYGQNMYPNMGGRPPMPGINQMPSLQQNQRMQYMPNMQMPGMQPMPGMQRMPTMQQMPSMQQMPGMGYNPNMNFPSFGVPQAFGYSGGIYSSGQPRVPSATQRIPPGYTPYIPMDNDDEDGGACNIQ
jgi:serine/threonine protein kinase